MHKVFAQHVSTILSEEYRYAATIGTSTNEAQFVVSGAI